MILLPLAVGAYLAWKVPPQALHYSEGKCPDDNVALGSNSQGRLTGFLGLKTVSVSGWASNMSRVLIHALHDILKDRPNRASHYSRNIHKLQMYWMARQLFFNLKVISASPATGATTSARITAKWALKHDTRLLLSSGGN